MLQSPGPYQAIATESVLSGRGLIPTGVNTYIYIVDLDDGNILVASTYDFAGQPYARNQQVLNQMVKTLDITR